VQLKTQTEPMQGAAVIQLNRKITGECAFDSEQGQIMFISKATSPTLGLKHFLIQRNREPVRGQSSVVGIATRYGFAPWWRQYFPHQSKTGPGSHPTFPTMDTGSFQRATRPGHGADHLHSSSAEVKERTQLCL